MHFHWALDSQVESVVTNIHLLWWRTLIHTEAQWRTIYYCNDDIYMHTIMLCCDTVNIIVIVYFFWLRLVFMCLKHQLTEYFYMHCLFVRFGTVENVIIYFGVRKIQSVSHGMLYYKDNFFNVGVIFSSRWLWKKFLFLLGLHFWEVTSLRNFTVLWFLFKKIIV